MRLALRWLAVPAVMLTLTGCDEMENWGSSDRFQEEFRREVPLRPGGKLAVENSNGSIEVIGWERNTVEIAGTKYASTEDLLRQIQVDVTNTADSVRIRTVVPRNTGNWRRGGGGARYVIHVPVQTTLEDIGSSNGSIRAENLKGMARLHTSNGRVQVSQLEGDVDVRTSNGSIEARSLRGAAFVQTSNGAIRIDEAKGRVEAVSSNGSVTVRLTDPEPRQPVRLESSNGAVELTMSALRGNPVRMHTSNSSVTLRLPAQVDAQVEASTSNSSITSDFDLSAGAGQVTKRRLSGTLGKGGPLLDLTTSNASIRLLRTGS